MGLPNKGLQEVHAQFKSDMESYAGNWPEDARFYSPILNRLIEVIKSVTPASRTRRRRFRS